MKKQKIMSALLGLCLLLSLLLVPVQSVQAAQGNATVQDARNGVVQVAVNVLVDKQELGFLTVGSGFVVGCKLRLNGTPVPLLRNGYSIFNGTKYR